MINLPLMLVWFYICLEISQHDTNVPPLDYDSDLINKKCQIFQTYENESCASVKLVSSLTDLQPLIGFVVGQINCSLATLTACDFQGHSNQATVDPHTHI